jgi:DNA polymerase
VVILWLNNQKVISPMEPSLKYYYLQQMGIHPWISRQSRVKKNELSQLEKDVSTCERCPLHLTRTQTVFARGALTAPLMVIAAAPSSEDERQGQSLMGKAGILLNNMLRSVGIDQNEVYITTLLKCKLPAEREPLASELQECAAYLSHQIALVAPQVILALGVHAGQFFLKEPLTLNQMRTSLHEYHGIPVLVSDDLLGLLSASALKKRAYQDLQQLKQLLKSNYPTMAC